MRSLKKKRPNAGRLHAFSPSLRWHYPDQVQRVGG
jgi:hypothetical protein